MFRRVIVELENHNFTKASKKSQAALVCACEHGCDWSSSVRAKIVCFSKWFERVNFCTS